MSKKILLADDSITIQKVISITFASEDYELHIVGDGDAAIKKASEIKPDLVLADIAMPGKSGYEVCSSVKSNPALQKTPVLLLAGTFEPLNKDEAIRAGADDSIVKPFESQELLDKVRELLSRHAEAVPAGRVGETHATSAGSDVWEAGDFLSIPEEFETKKAEAPQEPSADLDFLSSGALFEEEPVRPLSSESEFTDLIMDEDFKATDAKDKKTFDSFGSFDSGHSFDLGAGLGKEESRHSEKTAQPKEEPRAASFEMEPFDIEPFKSEPAASDFETAEWDLPSAPIAEEKEAEQFAEPDLLEIPEEAIERAEAAPFSEPAEIPSFGRLVEPPVPLREVMASVPAAQPAPRVSEDDLRKAAERIEARLSEELNARLSKAEARANEAIERVAAKMEERLRGELSAKLGKAEMQAAQAIERVAAKVEERLRNELTARLEKALAVPREQLETLVKKASKDVIEHVAWEVLPEMSERLIKAEINRVKEALVRLK